MRKILCVLLGLLFTIPSFANCNLTQRIINKTYTGAGSSVSDANATISDITYKENTPYTITIDVEPSDITFSEHGNLLWWSIQYTDNTYDYTGVTTGNYNNGRISVTTAANKTVKSISGLANHQRWTGGTLKVSNLKIEEGSSATAYTPYDANCVERCKNLFDASANWIPYNGVAEYVSIPVPNGTYTCSTNMPTETYSSANVWFDNQSDNFATTINPVSKDNNRTVTVTNGMLYIAVRNNYKEGLLNGTYWVQLEQGDTATAYVPYVAACHKIQVATTKYVETQFSDLSTRLAAAVATVNTVVTNTINQAASIATLQSGKQTRPADDTCPAYKQCLLVEDEQGVPHWYQITDPFRDFVAPIITNNVNAASSTGTRGYTQLEYIESTRTQYIDTGITLGGGTNYKNTDIKLEYDAVINQGTRWQVSGTLGSAGIFVGVNPGNNISYNAGQSPDIVSDVTNPYVRCLWINDAPNGRVTVKNMITGVNILDATYTPEIQTSLINILLFNYSVSDGSASNNYMDGKMYGAKIYDNGTIIRNFVPVIDNATGKVGMYDTVGQRFYGNAATSGDDFTPGPIVDNDADVPGMTWSATWAANATTGVSAGTVSGEALCNGVSGTYATAATSSQLSNANWNTIGVVCWCKASGLTVGGEYNVAPSSDLWVYSSPYDSTTECVYRCMTRCATYVREHGIVRSVLFGM